MNWDCCQEPKARVVSVHHNEETGQDDGVLACTGCGQEYNVTNIQIKDTEDAHIENSVELDLEQ